jgi:hypothetical protein
MGSGGTVRILLLRPNYWTRRNPMVKTPSLRALYGIHEDIRKSDAEKVKDPQSLQKTTRELIGTMDYIGPLLSKAAMDLLPPGDSKKITTSLGLLDKAIDDLTNASHQIDPKIPQYQKAWAAKNTLVGRAVQKGKDIVGKAKGLFKPGQKSAWDGLDPDSLKSFSSFFSGDQEDPPAPAPEKPSAPVVPGDGPKIPSHLLEPGEDFSDKATSAPKKPEDPPKSPEAAKKKHPGGWKTVGRYSGQGALGDFWKAQEKPEDPPKPAPKSEPPKVSAPKAPEPPKPAPEKPKEPKITTPEKDPPKPTSAVDRDEPPKPEKKDDPVLPDDDEDDEKKLPSWRQEFHKWERERDEERKKAKAAEKEKESKPKKPQKQKRSEDEESTPTWWEEYKKKKAGKAKEKPPEPEDPEKKEPQPEKPKEEKPKEEPPKEDPNAKKRTAADLKARAKELKRKDEPIQEMPWHRGDLEDKDLQPFPGALSAFNKALAKAKGTKLEDPDLWTIDMPKKGKLRAYWGELGEGPVYYWNRDRKIWNKTGT